MATLIGIPLSRGEVGFVQRFLIVMRPQAACGVGFRASACGERRRRCKSTSKSIQFSRRREDAKTRRREGKAESEEKNAESKAAARRGAETQRNAFIQGCPSCTSYLAFPVLLFRAEGWRPGCHPDGLFRFSISFAPLRLRESRFDFDLNLGARHDEGCGSKVTM